MFDFSFTLSIVKNIYDLPDKFDENIFIFRLFRIEVTINI
jgi:hypothetical protein